MRIPVICDLNECEIAKALTGRLFRLCCTNERLCEAALPRRKTVMSGLQKPVAIAFPVATGLCNRPYRKIFDVWCGDPVSDRKTNIELLLETCRI